jgi:hypothetical protein
MQQSQPVPGTSPAAYAALLEPLDAQVDALGEKVARDVARGAEPDAAELEASRAAVRWLLHALRSGPVPGPAALRPLRDGAAAQARGGGAVQPVLDRALSAGWVAWAAVTAQPGLPGPALAALGEALLRTGDAAPPSGSWPPGPPRPCAACWTSCWSCREATHPAVLACPGG